MTIPRFASDRIRDEWNRLTLAPLTQIITLELCVLAVKAGWEPLLTCVWRSTDEDAALGGTGIHTAWRAVDVRTREVDEALVKVVTFKLNARWQYDPARPDLVCVVHKPHGTGPHLHVQSHGATHIRA